MSLYYVQKFLFHLNRDPTLQARYRDDRQGALDGYDLTAEEIEALVTPDIGLLFHLGVNGQILMHFAALHQIAWADYLQLMRDGIATHGPVREGVYAMTGYEGVDAHAARLGQASHAVDGRRRQTEPRRTSMTLVYVGVCSHAPGITGRADQADPEVRDAFYAAFDGMRAAIEATRPDALVVVAAEHFANFFMDNMPSFAIGMADAYDGPIEDPGWLGIEPFRAPGHRDLSSRLIAEVMQTVDVAYAEEWKFDHGIAVPLHFLTPRFDLPIVPVNVNCQGPPLAPMTRAWALGEALRRAAGSVPERIALVATGGISHWPATPDSGKINEAWDRELLDRWCRNDRESLLGYDDLSVYAEAGQGGFEIRTYVVAAAAADGAPGTVHFYAPIPIFSVGCTIASYDLSLVESVVSGTG